MSFAITDQVLSSNLPAGLQHTLAMFATFADAGGLCWPSNETIARRSHKDERTVRRHVDELADMGVIERTYRKGKTAITRIITAALTPTAPRVNPTLDILPGLPRTFCPPEPAIETVNEITAQAAAPVLIEVPAVAAIVVSESVNAELPDTQLPDTATAQPLPEPVATEALPLPIEPATAPIEAFADVPADLLIDFGTVRKTKKKSATVTKTEAAVFASEAAKAGLTVAQAVRECILRGWSRFEAGWLPATPTPTPAGPPKYYTPEVQVPATPAVKAAGLAAIAALRERIATQAKPKGYSVLT